MRSVAHKKAKETIEKINKDRNNYNIIHYSCESFKDNPDRSVRITSISILSLRYGQTTSYSIIKEAELMHIQKTEITKHYNELEKSLLKKYMRYLSSHINMKWIHWNMRDDNYGFHAIEHRAKFLGISPVVILDENKIDLAVLLKDYYGKNYIEHPQMHSLAHKNDLNTEGFLGGGEEAEAFVRGDYFTLNRSTFRKVQVIKDIFDLVADEQLKTNSSRKEIYGSRIQSLFDYLNKKWWIQIILYLIPIVIGVLCGLFMKTN